jgi:hydrogenase-4 component B
MNLFSIITLISIIIPVFVGIKLGKDFFGIDLPIFFGLILQTILGSIILLYSNGYETKEKNKVSIGYFLFFLGLSGSFLSGKSIWLCIFWEVSSLGAFLVYAGQGYSPKAIKSIVALFLASSISMFFISAWVFLPDSNLSFSFLIIGLLIKSAFSILHVWYPEAYVGTPAHLSAAFSGLMINVPLLIFARYCMYWFNEINMTIYLIPIAGVGVFIGGISSFFTKDVKKSLAYSTIENSNFLWMFLFIASYWIRSENEIQKNLSQSFYVLFFIMLLHHSFSKTFQFLSLGYICKISRSTLIDTCTGFGRTLNISPILLGIGTFSFCAIPGTLGFVAESTTLFLVSKAMDLSGDLQSLYILLAIIFAILGMILGSATHLRLYLPLVLSVPRNELEKKITPDRFILFSLKILGFFIFLIPVFLLGFSLMIQYSQSMNLILKSISVGLNFQTPPYLMSWLNKILYISSLSFFFFFILYIFRFSHKIKQRNIWDCGNEYRGAEVSIPASVISDPLYNSIGRYFVNKKGEPYIDDFLKGSIYSLLDMGKFWIHKVESGEISQYILFSAVSFLFSLFFIIALKIYI